MSGLLTFSPVYAGEITPIVIAFLLGILFGTQFKGEISKRTTIMLLGLSVIAALLFEAPLFTWSLVGGHITEGVGLAMPFISAIIGLLIGKMFKGGK